MTLIADVCASARSGVVSICVNFMFLCSNVWRPLGVLGKSQRREFCDELHHRLLRQSHRDALAMKSRLAIVLIALMMIPPVATIQFSRLCEFNGAFPAAFRTRVTI